MSIPCNRAFTLIELSIVLVIIGLVVGGIMTGKTLIQQAEIRAAASQLQKFETAYRTFQVKYGCIMGDCANATDFFGTNYVVVASGCPPSGGAGNGNGNGDGFIDQSSGLTSNGTWRCEPIQALKSLSLSGFLPSDMSAPCQASLLVYFKGINDSCAFFYKNTLWNNYNLPLNAINWANIQSGGFSPISGALSPVQARLIDEKLDDGNPTNGKFRVLDAALLSGGGVVANSCVTSGIYNTNEDNTCRSLYYFK